MRTTLSLCGLLLSLGFLVSPPESKTAPPPGPGPDRSPVDLVLTPDERYLLTANQTAGTVSLVRLADGKVLAEVPCGQRPSALALTPDGQRVLVTGTFSEELTFFRLEGTALHREGSIRLSFEPRGVAVSPDGKSAYVALTSAHALAVVDLETQKEVARIPAGRWPRYLALSADGKRLAAGVSGDGGVAVIDPARRARDYLEPFVGLNLGQMQVSKDGLYVYFPFMSYEGNPITAVNIRRGWVLASRIGRVRLDKHVRREAIALDPRGQAVSDPHGLALSPDEQWLVCAASGTHELLVYRMAGLPWMDYGGPGDHIHPDLLKDPTRFYRIPLGGRPMAVRFSADGQRVYVANYLLNAVQVVDWKGKKVVETLGLGGPAEPSPPRKGEALFFDGGRSLDQWYSCHSCHYEGHTNSVAMDTRNDGTVFTFKTVLSLRNVAETGPWTWHGWQEDLKAGLRKSLRDTMLTPRETTEDDLDSLLAFLKTLRPPPNPYRQVKGSLSPASQRGKEVFESAKANCIRCHSGRYFTNGKIHNVLTGTRGDAYRGYNPPSLLGVYDRVLYLHDGRARSLEEMLDGPHSPEKVTGKGALTTQERKDLLAYLKSL